ncbi:pyridine nucleotide-disulfide oxidoreductase domain-containing protein 1 [Cimex lectularius]|uniref:Pyridine nucleotide-disulfide oxidoreductase domain-containing protein 1 n=1 Tax=Cimex lectularius TaxID=79782 RepID=A0A8I6RK68_CIMLE|nr:pyridine nucleotide-disulfide oxidoreductase domain-containing protein 1 [Cimex lectularius]
MREATIVIIGGGIAGVSCLESLAILAPDVKVILISASPVVKTVTNLKHLTKMLAHFDVKERDAQCLSDEYESVSVIIDEVVRIDHGIKSVYTKSGIEVNYEKLCICTGASPKVLSTNPRILTIRDTDSVRKFQKYASNSKKMVVVGNGGIATELVHEITGMEIVWAIKDKHISATFIDPGAAEFFQDRLKGTVEEQKDTVVKRMKYTVEGQEGSKGAALGPDWHTNVNLQGLLDSRQVTVEYSCHVVQIKDGDDTWPVYVELSNNKTVGCDFVVSAIGVHPNVNFLSNSEFDIAEDGGLKVNWKMETSQPDVYAAGDVCSTGWDLAPQWFQMRLWTQARQMGMYVAKSMCCSIRNEELLQDFCFELFTHVTTFFGMKVTLLGLFNGQTLDGKYEILLRVTKNKEYIKLILKDGRMQGAVLIGDTDIEEMCENLILNQLDLTVFGSELLNPDIDIDDYFD